MGPQDLVVFGFRTSREHGHTTVRSQDVGIEVNGPGPGVGRGDPARLVLCIGQGGVLLPRLHAGLFRLFIPESGNEAIKFHVCSFLYGPLSRRQRREVRAAVYYETFEERPILSRFKEGENKGLGSWFMVPGS
ncbi:MAG: hypothetical protein ABIJ52_00280 [Pseudomonadota bacterium]